MNAKVVIMSGISGSGKSTWIKEQKWFSSCLVFSADHYFMVDGEYKFDHNLLDLAHRACLKKFIDACYNIEQGVLKQNTLVIDNTNLSVEEIAPYYSVARAFNFDVDIVTIDCDPEIAQQRNAHGVDLKTIVRMSNRLKNRFIPGRWTFNKITVVK